MSTTITWPSQHFFLGGDVLEIRDFQTLLRNTHPGEHRTCVLLQPAYCPMFAAARIRSSHFGSNGLYWTCPPAPLPPDEYLRYARSANLFHFVVHPLPLCPSKLYRCCLQVIQVQIALNCALAEPPSPFLAHSCPEAGKPTRRGCRRHREQIIHIQTNTDARHTETVHTRV